eukprot:scaffold61413_cov20-Tisochrysis_lutea.AAC.7
MAKASNQKQQKHQATTPKGNHALKAKATPLKPKKKEAANASKPSPQKANGVHKGASQPATHAADEEEQRCMRALQRVNMGPTGDEDMSEDQSGGPDSDSDSDADGGKQDGPGPGSDREAYERALRRMEMG